MNRRPIVLLWLAVLLTAVTPSLASATQATPSADAFTKPSDPTELLFDTSELGDGWVLVDPVVTDVINTAVWEASANAVYAGPNGTRVSIAIRFVAAERDAVLAAEDMLDEITYAYEYYLLIDPQESDAAAVRPCESMQWIEGIDMFWQVTGFSSCAIGLDIVLWVETKGEVLDRNGIAASAAVIDLMLNG